MDFYQIFLTKALRFKKRGTIFCGIKISQATRKHFSLFSFLYCIGQIHCYIEGDLGSEKFTRGQRVSGSVFQEIQNVGVLRCIRTCHMLVDCQVVGYDRKSLHCELGRKRNMTKTASETWYLTTPDLHPEVLSSSCDSSACSEGERCLALESGKVKCLKVNCGPPPIIVDTVVSSDISTIGTSVKYYCSKSMGLNVSESLTCLTSGMWSTGSLTCDGVDVFMAYYQTLPGYTTSTPNSLSTSQQTLKGTTTTELNPLVTTVFVPQTAFSTRASTSPVSTATTSSQATTTSSPSSSSPSSSSSCDAPYSFVSLNNICFAFFDAPKPYTEANKQCTEDGGHLFMATSQQKLKKIFNEISGDSSGKSLTFFIDGSDEASEGSFVYHNGQTVDLSLFAKNEPNGGVSENCMMAETGSIVDVPCDRSGAYVCEKDML